jgi:hypothetical protein
MATAAIANAFVFPVETYQNIPVLDHEKVTCEESKLEVNVDVNDNNSTPTAVEHKETHIQAPGTSIRVSVQDVVLGGGHHINWRSLNFKIATTWILHVWRDITVSLMQVVKDVALTIPQAVGPMEKGVGKIQEKFHHIRLKPGDNGEPEVEIKEHVTENEVDGQPVAVDAEVEWNRRHKIMVSKVKVLWLRPK